jgi:hypothetical protein
MKMAFNNPYYYPTQSNAYLTQMGVAPTQQNVQPQIQNGGFVSVRNEMEARNYPVALGNSVTFKDETAPYIYTKTMGFSQLDVPRFDKYRLVKEEAKETGSETSDLTKGELYDDKPIFDSLDEIKAEIGQIWDEIDGLKKKPISRTKKKEVEDDDTE